jgi:hypothetical protein
VDGTHLLVLSEMDISRLKGFGYTMTFGAGIGRSAPGNNTSLR